MFWTASPVSGQQNHCKSQTLAGGGWRVPTFEELFSLIDPTRQKPAISLIAFPDTPSELFWSSTPLAHGLGVWILDFGFAYNAASATDVARRVRCVR